MKSKSLLKKMRTLIYVAETAIFTSLFKHQCGNGCAKVSIITKFDESVASSQKRYIEGQAKDVSGAYEYLGNGRGGLNVRGE